MPVPAKNANPGAEKCVTHRVKKTPGSGPPAGTPAYTRTWSMAMRTMMTPRMRSRLSMRRGAVEVMDSALGFGLSALGSQRFGVPERFYDARLHLAISGRAA